MCGPVVEAESMASDCRRDHRPLCGELRGGVGCGVAGWGGWGEGLLHGEASLA